jgi:hypothetical protein
MCITGDGVGLLFSADDLWLRANTIHALTNAPVPKPVLKPMTNPPKVMPQNESIAASRVSGLL